MQPGSNFSTQNKKLHGKQCDNDKKIANVEKTFHSLNELNPFHVNIL